MFKNNKEFHILTLLAEESERLDSRYYESTSRVDTEEISRWNNEASNYTPRINKSYNYSKIRLKRLDRDTTKTNHSSSLRRRKPTQNHGIIYLSKNIQPINVFSKPVISLLTNRRNRQSILGSATHRIQMKINNKERVTYK